VMFWPVLWLSLNWAARWLRTSEYNTVLFDCDQFGFVSIYFLGDRKDAAGSYRPLARVLPHWTDDRWATRVPAIARIDTETLLTLRLDAISFLHRFSGGGVSGLCPLTEGAPFFLNYDTS
jgi:hypothetical protein